MTDPGIPHQNKRGGTGVAPKHIFLTIQPPNTDFDYPVVTPLNPGLCFKIIDRISRYVQVADLGGAPGAHPPYGSKFSQFHAVFRKIWQNHMLAPPRGLAPPPTRNPGSAPVFCVKSSESVKIFDINVSKPLFSTIFHVLVQ